MANEFMNAEMGALNTSMRKVEEDLSSIVPGINSLAKASGKTLYTENTTPYTFRKTPSEAVSTEKVKEIIGASVGWNQLFPALSNATVNGITLTASNGVYTLNGTSTSRAQFASSVNDGRVIPANHLMLFLNTITTTGTSTGRVDFFFLATRKDTQQAIYPSLEIFNTAGQKRPRYIFQKYSADITLGNTILDVTAPNTVVTNVNVCPQIIDLTAMFGTTIADYIYSLETATAGAGVEWIRENCPSLLEYHEYGAGSIKSVNVSGHKVTGFNQWDEEWELGGISPSTGEKTVDNTRIRTKNRNPIIPNAQYYLQLPSPTTLRVYFYDADGNYLVDKTMANVGRQIITAPANACYYMFIIYSAGYGTTYYHDICINFSDPDKNGTYEPYHGITYPVTQTDLRGVFSLSDGKLVASGDVYSASGQGIRKYNIVDLGTLTWAYQASNQQFYSSEIADGPSSWDYNVVCSKYVQSIGTGTQDYTPHVRGVTGKRVYIVDPAYTDAATFKSAMSGVYLVYELATPTTETLDPYSEEQYCSPYGTEEWVGSDIPVGHVTEYASNDNDKLKTLMGSFGGDGLYLVRQENGVTALVPIPDPSSKADGTYSLKATVSSGVVTYNWS